ncbi:helix-turn-helix domain-containing protein [Anaerostipes sp.]|jgi:transcriptional regulator with XRE-family HTH domain|uniref:helix-turn-helix domain-containing protein n=1 Tax=Anaerostipes sp. TaxID=1872530 RepID=UPI003966D826
MIDIGENIREIRKLKGMTQKELGNKLGISQSAINQFENNKTAPKLQTIEKLAIALEVSMYDILKRGAEYYQQTGVNLDINIIKNALHSNEVIAETPLDKVTVTALKELLEYKETGLTPQDIKDMDKMYLEKCQQVNKLTCTCEMYERMAKK